MADPVAWTLIERGWHVTGSDGTKLGAVDEVLGDPEADIFDGLAVTEGLLKPTRYVAAEQVGEIVENEIHLTIGKQEFDRLPKP